jgi:hypothetical protein
VVEDGRTVAGAASSGPTRAGCDATATVVVGWPGTFRDDLGADALAHLFGGLVLAAKQTTLPRTRGVEQTAASLASLFLDGARRHP